MNAIDFIKLEHDEVLRLIGDLQSVESPEGGDRSHTTMFIKLQDALTTHSAVMKECFYPKVEKIHGPKDWLNRTEETNANIENMLTQMAGLSPIEKRFKRNLLELKSEFEEQARLEENKMIPLIEKLLSENELEIIGQRMEHVKTSRAFEPIR